MLPVEIGGSVTPGTVALTVSYLFSSARGLSAFPPPQHFVTLSFPKFTPELSTHHGITWGILVTNSVARGVAEGVPECPAPQTCPLTITSSPE